MNRFHTDFTRWIWTSAQAKEVWEPRIREIVRVWGLVENHAVVRGVRSAALVFPTVEELPEATRRAAAHGLLLLPLSLEGAGAVTYSATASPYAAGQPGKYRAVLVRPEAAGAALEAWGRSNEESIGMLLGYPACCSRFYIKTWVQEQRVDTTAAMVEEIGDTAGPIEANILLRWLGVRLVPHLPCSFSCPETVEFGKRLSVLWAEVPGGAQALVWAQEMLSWPVQWTALHGIAEIQTPILTICSRTDWTPSKAIVAKQGTGYPEEGAQGLRFPYRIVKDKLTKAPSFQRSVTPVWELNGFSSPIAMDAAHAALLAVLPAEPGSFLDLGCGNGRLLERAQKMGWRVEGIESDPVRAGAGQLPIRRGDLFNTELWNNHYDVVAVMPGRLIEADQKQAAEFLNVLRRRARHVLVYAYGDWLERFGGLGPLSAEAGLGAGDIVLYRRGDGVEAALLTFGGSHDSN
jgi:hypothetical protein